MTLTKVGRRGQLTLPREVRRQLNLKEGDHVAFFVQGEHAVMQPLTQTLLDLRGSVPVSGPQDFDQIRQQVVSQRARQAAKHGD